MTTPTSTRSFSTTFFARLLSPAEITRLNRLHDISVKLKRVSADRYPSDFTLGAWGFFISVADDTLHDLADRLNTTVRSWLWYLALAGVVQFLGALCTGIIAGLALAGAAP